MAGGKFELHQDSIPKLHLFKNHLYDFATLGAISKFLKTNSFLKEPLNHCYKLVSLTINKVSET